MKKFVRVPRVQRMTTTRQSFCEVNTFPPDGNTKRSQSQRLQSHAFFFSSFFPFNCHDGDVRRLLECVPLMRKFSKIALANTRGKMFLWKGLFLTWMSHCLHHNKQLIQITDVGHDISVVATCEVTDSLNVKKYKNTFRFYTGSASLKVYFVSGEEWAIVCNILLLSIYGRLSYHWWSEAGWMRITFPKCQMHTPAPFGNGEREKQTNENKEDLQTQYKLP